MSRVEEILSFWFGQPQDDQRYYDEWHKRWFAGDPHFDQTVRDQFLPDYELAAARKLMDWQNKPHSGLALVVLLDQFPRNMFRNTPRAFAADALAREVTEFLIRSGSDQQLLPVERMFLYLPFMHSEDRLDQQRSVALFHQLLQDRNYLNSYTFAVQHQEVIERFGRFPHRNAVLGRSSTPEESEFLQQPGSSFSPPATS